MSGIRVAGDQDGARRLAVALGEGFDAPHQSAEMAQAGIFLRTDRRQGRGPGQITGQQRRGEGVKIEESMVFRARPHIAQGCAVEEARRFSALAVTGGRLTGQKQTVGRSARRGRRAGPGRRLYLGGGPRRAPVSDRRNRRAGAERQQGQSGEHVEGPGHTASCGLQMGLPQDDSRGCPAAKAYLGAYILG